MEALWFGIPEEIEMSTVSAHGERKRKENASVLTLTDKWLGIMTHAAVVTQNKLGGKLKKTKSDDKIITIMTIIIIITTITITLIKIIIKQEPF